MLDMAVNERQDDLDVQLAHHVELSYNYSWGAASGLARSEVRMGRLLLFPHTVFGRAKAGRHAELGARLALKLRARQATTTGDDLAGTVLSH